MKAENKVLNFASILEDNTREQAEKSASLPFVEPHVALMPDAHLGYGATVGSVIPTKGAIIPSAVGVDIGCGMIAVETDLKAEDLPDSLGPLHGLIREAIPAGVGQGHEDFKTAKILHKLGGTSVRLSDKQSNTALRQMGTLGSGNHFVEVCLDERDQVWYVLHSGSRGIGNQLARYHIERAKADMERFFIELPDPDLAYFVEKTESFNEYWNDLQWAQQYAFQNRATMAKALHSAFEKFMGREVGVERTVNCHHNYTELEHHYGKNLYVTRKGAIRAREGDFGVIPGSMGNNSFIVSGKGFGPSLESAPHGAGRVMSRGQAKRELTAATLAERMAGVAWNDRQADSLVDEHPDSYKDITQVMEDSKRLVNIEHELTAVLNYKGV